jgi:carbamoyl-phosphate synthase large subunit
MYTILVTGVGAIIGYGIIRSLRASRYPVRVIGIDIYEDAVGKKWCDAFERAVLTNAPEHPDFLGSILRKYSVDLVIPGIEQDVTRMAGESYPSLFPSTRFALNDPELIGIADDKWLTYLAQRKAGIPAIETRIEGDFESLTASLGVPLLLKPRKSYASKGIQRLDSEEDMTYWKRKLGKNFMVQEIVGDDEREFTVGVFGLGEGAYSGAICFQRKLSGEGSTLKARVVRHPALDDCIDRLVKLFRPVGPTNLQFRCHNGKYLLLEINPRISSSTSLRTAFGYNEAEMCIEYFLEGSVPLPREIRPGSAIRYIEDLITYDSDHL